MKLSGLAMLCLAVCLTTFAQDHSTTLPANYPASDKPRVFITDSQSWEMSGSAGGSNGSWGAQTHGGARPQTAEIIKTFGERCSEVMVNNKQDMADYIVLLDHEGGKGVLRHKNKVAVFQKASGDAVISHSTLSLGGSVQDACEGIVRLVGARRTDSRCCAKSIAPPAPTPAVVEVSTKSAAVPVVSPKISVASTPDGADIEIDGSL